MKSEVIKNIHKFLLLIESEKCDDLPWIQLQSKALRWDLEQIFKFPENAVLTNAMHSDGEDRMVCPACQSNPCKCHFGAGDIF